MPKRKSKGRSEWSGKGWSRKSRSEFTMPEGPSIREQMNPVNKEYREGDRNAPSSPGEIQIPREEQESYLRDEEASPVGDIRKYNPFNYRTGDGEDGKPTQIDKKLAQEPSGMGLLKLPPIVENFLHQYAQTHDLTQHEGRKWVLSPESISHYHSSWKRYQKSLSLQPSAVVEDSAGESEYRFFSDGSRSGYWKVIVGTSTDGAGSITVPKQIFSLCESVIRITAVIEPSTSSGIWEQISGQTIPFVYTDGGRLLELFRVSQVGPFVFRLTIGGLRPLEAVIRIDTSPLEFVSAGYGGHLDFLSNPAKNIRRTVTLLADVTEQTILRNNINILFDPPDLNTAYVTQYFIERFDGSVWTVTNVVPVAGERRVDSIAHNTFYRIRTFFDIYTRGLESVTPKFKFENSSVDVYVPDTLSTGFGTFTPIISSLQRIIFSRQIVEDPFAIFGIGSRGSFTRYTAFTKREEDSVQLGYGHASAGVFIRNDYKGTTIG